MCAVGRINSLRVATLLSLNNMAEDIRFRILDHSQRITYRLPKAPTFSFYLDVPNGILRGALLSQHFATVTQVALSILSVMLPP
jgi:hypothetical protein